MACFIWLDDKKYPEFSDNKREAIFSINQKGFCMAEFVKVYAVSGVALLSERTLRATTQTRLSQSARTMPPSTSEIPQAACSVRTEQVSM